ncbi:MAG: hypothetical protein V1668_00330 [Patescibacteria group bacterium]
MQLNRELLDKGIGALKPFLFAFQEGWHDQFFESDYGKRLRQMNKDSKGLPALAVGLLGSFVSSLETKTAIGDLVKSLGVDSSGMIMHRLRKAGLGEDDISFAEMMLTLQPDALKTMLTWSESAGPEQRQQLFGLLGSLSESQVMNFFALEDADRQKFLALLASTLPQKKQVKPGEFGAAIDTFASDFHREAEAFNTKLKERIAATRAKRLGSRRKRA